MALTIGDIMGQSVTIYKATGMDGYGKRTYATSGTVYSPARVQMQNKLVRDPQGREIILVGVVYVLGNCNVAIGDKIVLPDGTSPVIVDVNTEYDIDMTVHHTVINLTR